MKVKRWFALVIGIGMASGAMAANWLWDGDAFPDTSWVNPTNWKNDVMYTGNLPILQSGGFATVEVGTDYTTPSSPLRIGQKGPAELQIVGGKLGIQHNVYLGYTAGGTIGAGTLTVSNGTFTVSTSKDLIFANNGSSGVLNMYGGTVDVSRNVVFKGTGAPAGTATIGLYGGKLISKGLTVDTGSSVSITLESGLWEIGGDKVSNVTAMVTAGDITGSGSNGGADVSSYTFVTNNALGDLNWGLSIAGTTTNTVVYTIGTASSASLSLNPPVQLATSLVAPNTLSTGTVDVAFFYGSGSNGVQITDVVVDNAAFSSLDSFPIMLTDPIPSNTALSIQYDNAVGNLTNDQQTASGVISVIWNELGGGSTKTNELPVVLTYDDVPASLNLAPADILQFTVMTPGTTETKPITLSYTGATVDPTNVVIASVSFTNVIKGGSFTNLTALPITLPGPAPVTAPVTDALNIKFDAVAGGLAINEMARANVIIKWYELGHAVTNETVLPLVGNYVAPATGLIEDYGLTMPTNHIVFDSGAVDAAKMDAERTPLAAGGGYQKSYQQILGSEPKLAAVTNSFDGLILKMRFAADFSSSTNGANQLQMWFGKVDANGIPVATLHTDTFDCSGKVFTQHAFYQFKLSAPVDFNPANLGFNESYGFEIWWTADDANNLISFWRGNASSIAGGANTTSGNVSINPGFPVDMSNLIEAKDMVFALANGLSLVNSVGNVSVVGLDGTGNLVTSFDAEAGGTYALQRNLDLVFGTWSNVVEGITGVGPINTTNDTTKAAAFYRMILQ